MRFERRATVVSCVLLVFAGCDPGAPHVSTNPPDSAEAKGLLVAALDAWKAGKPLDGEAGPRFVDEDLSAGHRLVSYQIGEEKAALGNTWNVPVTLELTDRKGAKVSRAAVYQVVTQPAPAVFRNDP